MEAIALIFVSLITFGLCVYAHLVIKNKILALGLSLFIVAITYPAIQYLYNLIF